MNIYLGNNLEKAFEEHMKQYPKMTKSSVVKKALKLYLEQCGHTVEPESTERGQYHNDRLVLRTLTKIIKENGGQVTKKTLRELSPYGHPVISRTIERYQNHFVVDRVRNAYLISIDPNSPLLQKKGKKKNGKRSPKRK